MRRVRPVLSVIVGTLALIALICSVIGVWAHQVLFDDTAISSAVDEALQQPEVTDALAARITTEVVTAVDLEQRVEELLPGQLVHLAPALVGGITTRVEGRLSDLLAQPEVRSVIVGAVQQANSAFLDLLQGGGLVDGVTVQDGAVTLNLVPLVAIGIEQVQRLGFVDDVVVPEMQRSDDAAAQIAALSDAIGRDLPADFAQVVVYQSDRLADAGSTLDTAQRLVVVAQRAVWISIAVTVVAAIGAVLLARRRLRATLILLVSASVVFVIMRVLVRRVLHELPSMVVQSGAKAAVQATSSSLLSSLVASVSVVAILGIVGAIAVYMADPGSSPRRRAAAATGDGSLSAAVRQYRIPIAIGAVVAALLIITVAGLGWISGIVALLLAAGGVVAMTTGRPDAEGSQPAV